MTTTKNPPVWTAALRAACADIATQPGSADIKSRAAEIANGARVGAVLTDLNCEFITSMRSRFEPYGDALMVAAQRRFDDAWRDAWEAANPPPAPTFAATGWEGGDPVSIKLEGFTVTASIHRDDIQEAPWETEDGHGPVTGWVDPDGEENPGWRVLTQDRQRARFYDFAGAVERAKAEGWGPGTPEEAAQADYDRLRAWCDDAWCYVGVAVTVSRNGLQLIGTYGNALWGIESDAGAYLAEVADQLTGDALAEARQLLADLIEGDA